jgi:hypothetical protein
MKRWIGLAFALASAVAMAQGTAADDKKAAEKKAAEKKAADAKAAPRKPEEAPKKAAAAPKKATEPAKKPAATPAKKPADPPKGGAPTANPNVKVYKANDPNAPKVRDKDGKVIPTNPDAYDISSALKK